MAAVSKVAGILFALFLLGVVQPAFAEDRSFQISAVDIYARVDKNGDMQVEEQDTYHFDGAFNGIVVDLGTAGSDGITDFRAFEISDKETAPLRVERMDNGDRVQFKIYAQSADESKKFRFLYTVDNAVQVYTDMAELNWKFFDDLNPSKLDAVNVMVKLPVGIREEEIRTMEGAPSEVAVDLEDDGIVRYQISPLQPHEPLKVRIAFPEFYVPGSTRISSDSWHRVFLQDLQEEQQEARDGRETVYGAAVLLAANLLAGIYVKFGRTFRPKWKGRYLRELPDDVTPAVVGYLMDHKVKPRDLMATMLDLVRKQYVGMKMVDKGDGRRKTANYSFRLLKPNADGLLPHEANLIDWFFGVIGHGDKVTLVGIRDYIRKHGDAFRKRWPQWQEEVVQAENRLGYFQRQDWLPIGVLLAVVVQFFGFWFLAPEAWRWLMVCGLPLLLFIPRSKRRTYAGQTAYVRWKGFKRFLRDYTQIAASEPPEPGALSHYFVYAIPLGEAKKAAALTGLKSPGAAVTDGSDFGFYDYQLWTMSFEATIAEAYKYGTSRGESVGSSDSSGGDGGGGGGRDAF